jgi:hypothetical protein
MNASKIVITALLAAAFAPRFSRAAELQPGTLMAWNAYLKEADLRAQQRSAGAQPFLWIDEAPDRRDRVRRGEIVVAPVVGHGAEGVPHGLIHDWIGGAFIPGARIDGVLAVVHDYDNYQRMYRPVVTDSRTLSCRGANQEFQMTWQRKVLFVRAAIEGRYRAHDVMLGSQRGYSVAEAVEVREIEDYGQAEQRALPPDTGSGFIWRIRSLARFEEREGGVYLELEAMALTRDIPGSLAWMVNPVVNHLSVNSLTTTLRQTRDAVISLRGNPLTAASCPNTGRGGALKAEE